MSIWEVSNFAEPLTMVSDDFRAVVAAAMFMGQGELGVQEIKGERRRFPVLRFCNEEGADNYIRTAFDDPSLTLDNFLASVPIRNIARVLRTVQVCRPEDRAAYQRALEAIEDPKKRHEYANWWRQERLQTYSLYIIEMVRGAWYLADKLEERAAKQERESGLQQMPAS